MRVRGPFSEEVCSKSEGGQPGKRQGEGASERRFALTESERAQQMLNRFTFGARPDEVERVLSTGDGCSGLSSN